MEVAPLLTQALAYLTTHTAAWPREHLRSVVRQPATRAAALAVDTAVLAKDVDATKSACRQWWHAVLSQAPREEQVLSIDETVTRSEEDTHARLSQRSRD